MHIAFLTPEYPHKLLNKSGGLGTSIKNLAVQLHKKGHTVSIIVPYQFKNNVINDEGVTIHAIAKKKYVIASWFFYKKHLQREINKISREFTIDVIEGPDWTGIGTFINFSLPYTVRLNGSDTYFCHIEDRSQKFKNYWLEKQNFKKADAVLSASDFTGVITNQVFKTKKRITTIYNSINVEKFKPLNEIAVEPETILYFGTLIRKKGVLDFAYALNKLQENNTQFKVVFLGKDVLDYKEKKSTKSLIKETLNKEVLKNVSFIQEVPYDQVHKHIAQAGLVCLPSYAEAFPMTWLEAMAMEKALVTSNVGWAKEMMVDGETGYTVHPSEHALMAERIATLLNNPELAKNMGRNARVRVCNLFAAERVVEKNIDFYSKLLKV